MKKRIVERTELFYGQVKTRIIIFLFVLFISFQVFNLLYLIHYVSWNSRVTGFGSSTGTISISVEEWRSINVTNPLNRTYNFSAIGSYPLSLNATSNFMSEIHAWKYTLTDVGNNLTLNNSQTFTPNVTIYPARGSNRLVVFANRTGNYSYNVSVVFFINVSNSAPIIQNLSTSTLVCEGVDLSLLFNVSDVDRQVITPILSPQYPSNPFFIQFSYNVTPNLTTHEIYSGTLNKSDAGGIFAVSRTYTTNVSVSDGLNVDSRSINLTVIEINNIPIMQTIGAQTVRTQGDNTTFSYYPIVNDSESGGSAERNMTFNISFINATGGNVSLFSINTSTGFMNYTGNTSHIGSYNVTVCVFDQALPNPHTNISLCGQTGTNLTACKKFALTITNATVTETSTSGGGGGGGGGGADGGRGGGLCSEKWGCTVWETCVPAYALGVNFSIPQESLEQVFSQCNALSISQSACGYQRRNCLDLHNCSTNIYKPQIIQQCYYTLFPTCSDGILNCHSDSCEILVDCGGPCNACPTCSDSIKNQNEESIDCGGACPSCEEFPISPPIRSFYLFIAFILFIIAIILFIRYQINQYRARKIIREKFSHHTVSL